MAHFATGLNIEELREKDFLTYVVKYAAAFGNLLKAGSLNEYLKSGNSDSNVISLGNKPIPDSVLNGYPNPKGRKNG